MFHSKYEKNIRKKSNLGTLSENLTIILQNDEGHQKQEKLKKKLS